MDEQKYKRSRATSALLSVRFGPYELDLRSAELRRNNLRIRLQEQPFLILVALLERPGEVVLREELRSRLWQDNTVVEFDHGINAAVKRLRDALGDSAEKPRYIETLARKGYRFIGKVDVDPLHQTSASLKEEEADPAVELINNDTFIHETLPPQGFSKAGKTVLEDTTPQAVHNLKPVKAGGRFRRSYYGLAILLVLVIAMAGVAIWKRVSRASKTPRVLGFTKLTNDGQAKVGPLKTDGSRIYFNEELFDGQSAIVQVAVTGGESALVPVTLKHPRLLDLSNDGTELLVADKQEYGRPSALWILPIVGGSPRRIGTIFADDASFNSDKTGIIYSTGHDVYITSIHGTASRRLFSVASVPYAFRFAPNASSFRFTHLDESTGTNSLVEADASGSNIRTMFEGCCGEWTPDGRHFIFQTETESRSNLRMATEDDRHGSKATLTANTQLTAGPLDFQYPVVSKSGTEVFAIGVAPQCEVVRYDFHKRQFEAFLNGVSAEGVTFSADGKWVTYTSYPDGALWRSRADGTDRLQLTFLPMQAFLPRWAPDGKHIAFNAHLPGMPWNIYTISSFGGTAQRVLPSNEGQMDANWSPDGSSLVFNTDFNHPSIAIIDLRSKRVSTVPGSSGLFSPHWSPDGKYISGSTADGSMLMLLDVHTQKWKKASQGAVHYPTWSHDGKYLYFEYSLPNTNNDQIVRLRMSDRKIENVAAMNSTGRTSTGTVNRWFGLAADDSPLLARDISTQELYALTVDWQ